MEGLSERLRARAKAWRDLHELASHIGVFPLDACMIDSRLEDMAAAALEAAGVRAEPDGYAVLLDDKGATPGDCGYWYVGAYRTEVVAKSVAERNKGARVVPMYFSPTAATRFSLCVECNELVTQMSRLCAREDCPQSKP